MLAALTKEQGFLLVPLLLLCYHTRISNKEIVVLPWTFVFFKFLGDLASFMVFYVVSLEILTGQDLDVLLAPSWEYAIDQHLNWGKLRGHTTTHKIIGKHCCMYGPD